MRPRHALRVRETCGWWEQRPANSLRVYEAKQIPRQRVLTAASWLGGEDLHPPIERKANVGGVTAHRRQLTKRSSSASSAIRTGHKNATPRRCHSTSGRSRSRTAWERPGATRTADCAIRCAHSRGSPREYRSPPAPGGPVASEPQNSMRAPSSTTWFGGMLKKWVAELALRAMKLKSRFRHRIIRTGPVGRSCARPR